ncbi:MAG: AbrB/MazE/SpoVT family DNA-binding domain-containing protein [Lachnospiraceae bacterium]|nr:AbrB/MazE/SpoVT family DNA-binding domain-containing protein [Lachnospiraceae bacterium]
MKATGVIRAVDKLGRIVIPKEIRKNYHIREGDPIEIYTSRDGEIVLKKYSPMGELSNYAKSFAKTIAEITAKTVIISDRERIIASEGRRKTEYEDRIVSRQLENAMEARKIINTSDNKGQKIFVYEGEDLTDKSQIIYPILSRGDVIGTVGLISYQKDEEKYDFEEKILKVTAAFFGNLYS